MQFRVPGVCTVEWGGNSLGVAKGGIIIRSTPNWRPVVDDSGGDEPMDYIWAGRTVTVELVGLDETSLTAAALYGGGDGFGKYIAPGTLLDDQTSGQGLVITEADSSAWQAAIAEPREPDLILRATQEIQVPVLFLIIPDSNGQLFNVVPSYLS